MTHVFQDAPDGCRSGDIRPSRFRPGYRALSAEEKDLHDAIKAKAGELEALFERARALRAPVIEHLPPAEFGEFHVGIAVNLDADPFTEGMKSLELAVMWTVKGLTA